MCRIKAEEPETAKKSLRVSENHTMWRQEEEESKKETPWAWRKALRRVNEGEHQTSGEDLWNWSLQTVLGSTCSVWLEWREEDRGEVKT